MDQAPDDAEADDVDVNLENFLSLGTVDQLLQRWEDKLLNSDYEVLASMLRGLDASKRSIEFLYILDAIGSKDVSDIQKLDVVRFTSYFIEVCDATDIRLETEKFVSVCRRLKDYVLSLEIPGVDAMISAVAKLQSSPEKLTPLHQDALCLCVMEMCCESGLPLLENENISEAGIVLEDIILYRYYGGMVCIGENKFPEAANHLHKVGTAYITADAPSPLVVEVAVDACRMFYLVSLIHSGQVSINLPKKYSFAALSTLDENSQLYKELANTRRKGDYSELQSFVQQNKEQFAIDKNLELVNLVAPSMYEQIKKKIVELSKTSVVLSFQDIAYKLGLKSPEVAEMQVLRMIQDGHIFVRIDENGKVWFLPYPNEVCAELISELYKRTVIHINLILARIAGISNDISVKKILNQYYKSSIWQEGGVLAEGKEVNDSRESSLTNIFLYLQAISDSKGEVLELNRAAGADTDTLPYSNTPKWVEEIEDLKDKLQSLKVDYDLFVTNMGKDKVDELLTIAAENRMLKSLNEKLKIEKAKLEIEERELVENEERELEIGKD